MIILKSQDEVAKIRAACRVVAEVLEALRGMAKPGVTTKELDTAAETWIRRRGAIPAFKGYRQYPATLCTSLNDEVVHGIPSTSRYLRDGDLLSLDLGAIVEGYYGDAALTMPVGTVSSLAESLMRVTREALDLGIKQVRANNRIGDISHAIQQYVEAAGFSVVTSFVGHGIGQQLHEEPQVPNFGRPGQGPLLREGMVLAIEPMVNAQSSTVRILEDQWTAVTVDGALSAHFEHTVVVTQGDPEVLTRWP